MIAALMAMAIPLASCGQKAEKPDSQPITTGATQRAILSPTEKLLAAAEPFEKLTETAFAEPFSALDETISQARTAAADVRDLVSPASLNRMDGLLADVARYRQREERADIALASIEIYRLLVSAVQPGAKTPSDVSLLDYAGFRYQADLKASPARWADMVEATRFAQARWATVKPMVSSPPLIAAFEAALADMEKAIVTLNVVLAESSVTAELALVDRLGEYFSAR